MKILRRLLLSLVFLGMGCSLYAGEIAQGTKYLGILKAYLSGSSDDFSYVKGFLKKFNNPLKYDFKKLNELEKVSLKSISAKRLLDDFMIAFYKNVIEIRKATDGKLKVKYSNLVAQKVAIEEKDSEIMSTYKERLTKKGLDERVSVWNINVGNKTQNREAAKKKLKLWYDGLKRKIDPALRRAEAAIEDFEKQAKITKTHCDNILSLIGSDAWGHIESEARRQSSPLAYGLNSAAGALADGVRDVMSSLSGVKGLGSSGFVVQRSGTGKSTVVSLPIERIMDMVFLRDVRRARDSLSKMPVELKSQVHATLSGKFPNRTAEYLVNDVAKIVVGSFLETFSSMVAKGDFNWEEFLSVESDSLAVLSEKYGSWSNFSLRKLKAAVSKNNPIKKAHSLFLNDIARASLDADLYLQNPPVSATRSEQAGYLFIKEVEDLVEPFVVSTGKLMNKFIKDLFAKFKNLFEILPAFREDISIYEKLEEPSSELLDVCLNFKREARSLIISVASKYGYVNSQMKRIVSDAVATRRMAPVKRDEALGMGGSFSLRGIGRSIYGLFATKTDEELQQEAKLAEELAAKERWIQERSRMAEMRRALVRKALIEQKQMSESDADELLSKKNLESIIHEQKLKNIPKRKWGK